MSYSRKEPFVNGQLYHVMNKSIAGYEIFPKEGDYQRMLAALQYFSLKEPPTKFSYFLNHDPHIQEMGIHNRIREFSKDNTQVDIIAYCLMPTHIHVLVRQIMENGITELMRKSLNAYARYFNTKYKRKGTLWMSRFKNVQVTTDEQLLHLTRYIHLNPVTAGLVRQAADWNFSSYKEFIEPDTESRITTPTQDLLDISPIAYKKFVSDHAGFQKELALIKKQALE